MEQEPSLETVYQAIYTLYGNSANEEKSKANRWLMDLQDSLYGWKIADQLIHRQTDVDSTYFGIHMIRYKITRCFHELPQDAALSLHNSLLQYLTAISNETNNLIITQICVAIVDLSLQISSWKEPVILFLQQIGRIPQTALLEVLRVFPEEVNTENIRLGSNRRNEIKDGLSKSVGLMNEYLNKIIVEDASPELLLKVFRCFTSWIPVGLVDIPNIIQCEIINRAFQIFTNPPDTIFENGSSVESKLHDAASDLICYFLQSLRTPEAKSCLTEEFLKTVLSCEQAYHNTVARECTEKSMNYCRVFSDLVEAFLPKMVEESKPTAPHYSIRSLDLVLLCVSHHDYEVGSITFSSWYVLSETLYRIDKDYYNEEFKPYINRLIITLCRQVQMEPDHEGLLDDGDDFKLYRDKVESLIKDVVFIIGSRTVFQQMFVALQDPHLTWDQMEACLFVMHAVARNLLPDESQITPQAVDCIFKLPGNIHIAVKHTSLLILGELSEWFDSHPDYLVMVLNFLSLCLQERELANAAAISICSICYVGKEKLMQYFSPLMEILRNLNSFSLKNESSIDIIKSVSSIIPYLPREQITPAMKEICWLQASHIRNLLETSSTIAENEVVTKRIELCVWLDRLTAVFRFVNPSDGMSDLFAPILSELQPLLFDLMQKHPNDSKLMERCCRCFRFAIRLASKSSSFIMEPLIKLLTDLYRTYQQSCFLYLGSILVDEYGDNISHWKMLLMMIDAFIGPTFNLLKNEENIQEHPDVIDDLFRLASRYIQRLPIAFLSSPGIWPLMECSLAAINISHREANSSVRKFFHEMLNSSTSEDIITEVTRKEAVTHILEKHGENLTYNLIHASLNVIPVTIHGIGEVIYDLLAFNKKVTLNWLNMAIQKLSSNQRNGAAMATPEQIQNFLNICEKATSLKDISRGLREFINYYK